MRFYKLLIAGIILLTFLALPVSQSLAEKENQRPFFDKREKLQERIASKEANFHASREAFLKEKKERHEQFKEKLQTIKNEKKKVTLEKLETKIASISAKRTASMTNTLQKLQEIMGKITQNEQTLKQQGVDTTPSQEAIKNAQEALTAAEEAITTQSTKDYSIPLENEESAKSNVGSAIKVLQADLKDTHKKLLAAKKAIWQAHRAVRKLSKTAKISPSSAVQPTIKEE